MGGDTDITGLLAAARSGEKPDLDRLYEAVYGELRRIAHARRSEWRGNDTLNTTALVHEGYLKLVNQTDVHWQDRRRFFAAASKAMRRILIDYAHMRRAAKRGGGVKPQPVEDIPIATDEAADELLAMDQALARLAGLSRRQSQVVEFRFFAGLTVKETAEVLDISPATVKRDWALATAWLHGQMAV